MTQKPRVRVTTDNRVRVSDGFVNLAAQLGTSRDKASGSGYVYVPIHSYQLLDNYRQSWLAKKIVNIPAEDATSRWRSWHADEKIITAIEKAERLYAIQQKVELALKLARVFGGSALYISINGQDPEAPLDPKSVRSGDFLGVDVLTCYQLIPSELETDTTSAWWGLPKHFVMNGLQGNSTKIHPSRLAIFQGEARLSTTNLEWVWGDSVLQSTIEILRHHDGLVANAASLVFEANVDVLHIPRLMEMLRDPESELEVLTYLRTLASVKGNNGMLVLDGGDTSLPENNTGGTKYDRKSITFAGLADLWDRFMQGCSAASDIPVTRLFGRSPAGMNSTGEGDEHNYEKNVGARQRNQIQPALAVLDECLLWSTFGNRDESIYYDWRPLSEPTEKDKADVGKIVAETLKIVADMQVLPVETLQAAVVSALTEVGSLPGLEAAVDDHGLKLEEPEGDPDQQAAAIGGNRPPANANVQPTGPTRQRRVVVDAAPASLYVSRKVVNEAEIRRWAKAEGFEVVDDLHVTIAYSRNPVDWMQMGSSWDEEMTIPAGGPRVLDEFGSDEKVTVLRFSSESLQWRHERFKEAGASWDWPDYHPHITIAKGPIPAGAKPFTGRIVLGPEIFEELKDD